MSSKSIDRAKIEDLLALYTEIKCKYFEKSI